LVFEIGYGAKPAHNDPAFLLAYEVLQQAAEAFDFDVGIVTEHFAGNFNAFINGEERALVGTVGHADDDMIEQARRTAYQIFVATGKGIERSGIDGGNHACRYGLASAQDVAASGLIS